MSYEEIQAKIVKKGRKDYSCEWCSESIEKGLTHFYRVYNNEGDFNVGRMHLECKDAMERSPYDEISEGWAPGEPKRGKALNEQDQEGEQVSRL